MRLAVQDEDKAALHSAFNRHPNWSEIAKSRLVRKSFSKSPTLSRFTCQKNTEGFQQNHRTMYLKRKVCDLMLVLLRT